MQAWLILRRLCWKEWRQGWLLLALGIVLPPLAWLLSGVVDYRLDHYGFNIHTVSVTLFLLLVGVIVRAPMVVAGGTSRQSYAGAHFPLHPHWPLLVTFLFQGLIVALIGANFGWLGAPHQATMHAMPYDRMILVGVMCFSGVYLLAAALARAVSPLAGMAGGMLWLLFFGMHDTCQRLANPASVDYRGFWTSNNVSLALVMAGGFVAYLLLMTPRGELLTRRVVAVALLALVTIGFPLWSAQTNNWKNEANEVELPSTVNRDNSVTVMSDANNGRGKPLSLQFTDYRLGRSVTRQFTLPTLPLGIIGQHTAILLEKHLDEQRLVVARWDLDGNTMRPLLALPASSTTLKNRYMYNIMASFSPDERYALLEMPALMPQMEDRRDIWLLDLPHAQARLVIASTTGLGCDEESICWQRDKVILPLNGFTAIAVPSGAVSEWRLPAGEGRQ